MRSHRFHLVSLAVIGGAVASTGARPAMRCPPDTIMSVESGHDDTRCLVTRPATMFIASAAWQTMTIEVRTLRPDADLRCEELSPLVPCARIDSLFGPWRRQRLGPGEYAVLDAAHQGCTAALVRLDAWRPVFLAIGPSTVARIPFFGPPGSLVLKGGVYVTPASVSSESHELDPIDCEGAR